MTEHPLFFCSDGPGTGKSRLLDEFPDIVQHQLFGGVEDNKMTQLLKNAFTFKITFDRGMTPDKRCCSLSIMEIGTRMLCQLQDSMEWDEFKSRTAHHATPDEVLTLLAKLGQNELNEMCVILCVDDLDKIGHEEIDTSPYHSALNALNDLVHTSKCWLIVISSSTIYRPTRELLLDPLVWYIQLPTTRLSRPAIDGRDVFEEFGNDDLTSLLIKDMGGMGGAIEKLYSVMSKMKNKRAMDFAVIFERIIDDMRRYYKPIEHQVGAMREAFLSVIARRVVNANSIFGSANLDDVTSAGLITCRDNVLKCPHFLYLMIDSSDFPWHKLASYVPSQDRDDRMPWERFNCKFRALKSMAYAGLWVNWKDVHHGARFGSGCDRIVHEIPRVHKLYDKRMVTKCEGFCPGKCSCGNDSNNPVFVYQPADGSPSGDSFLCLEDDMNGFFHEVHQHKAIQGVLSKKKFKEEQEKAAGKDDLFVLYCAGNVSAKPSELQQCAIVDVGCRKQYYGPFSARSFFVKMIPPPCINTCADFELSLVEGVRHDYIERIIKARNIRRFTGYGDAHIRTGVPMHILLRYRLDSAL